MTGEDPLRLVLGKLPGHRKAGEEQYEARCPAHDDNRASLSVGVGADRKVLLKCQAGCELREILGALELAPVDLFPPKVERRQVAAYPYLDAGGQVLFEVVRFEPKDFRQRKPDGKGGWIWSIKDVSKVVYRLPELLAAAAEGREVWIGEGEKDVDVLWKHGLPASCNAGGAGKWLPEYSNSFAGASVAYVIPDDDAPGKTHARTVAMSLSAVVPLVKVVKLRAKDAAVFFANGGTVEQLKALAAAAPAFTAADATFEQLTHRALADVANGAKSDDGDAHGRPAFEAAGELLERDFPKTPWLVQGLLVEKAVAAIAGEPKTAKSWTGLELAMAVSSGTKAFNDFLTGAPRPTAVFLVEDDERSTRNRLRALAAGRGLDPKAALERMFVKCRGRLNLLVDEDLAWLVASVRSLPIAPELLVLDPLRDLHNAKENDSDAMAPVMGRLRLLRDLLGCAVVFVHHAGKAGETTNARRPGQRMRGSGVVHASVDGGLYLSNLDTDSATRFESTADVELKSVRGAGQFSLRLDVTDDDRGEAALAKWTVTKPEARAAAKGTDSLERAQAAVLKVLKAHRLMAMGPPSPLATRALQEKTQIRLTTVTAALAQLAAEGKAERAHQGKKAIGWLYLPSDAEKTASERAEK